MGRMQVIARDKFPLMLRKYAWDIIPCDAVSAFLPVVGLIPSSAEGAQVEHADSHQRLDKQLPVQPLIAIHAAFAARVTAAFALRMDINEYEDGLVEGVTKQFAETIHVGATTMIAQLIEDGYLQLGPKARPAEGSNIPLVKV